MSTYIGLPSTTTNCWYQEINAEWSILIFKTVLNFLDLRNCVSLQLRIKRYPSVPGSEGSSVYTPHHQ